MDYLWNAITPSVGDTQHVSRPDDLRCSTKARQKGQSSSLAAYTEYSLVNDQSTTDDSAERQERARSERMQALPCAEIQVLRPASRMQVLLSARCNLRMGFHRRLNEKRGS